MAVYPAMVRRRIVELYDQNLKTRQIAALFGISKSGTRRVKQHKRERGTLDPLPHRRGCKPAMTGEVEQKIREHVRAHPDSTREELKTALKLTVSLQSISRWLKKLGLVLKKSRYTPLNRTDPTSKRVAMSGMKN
jgi:transposase